MTAEGALLPHAIPDEVRAAYPDIFRAVWPVTDPTMPADELIGQARGDLRDVAARARVQVAARHGRYGFAAASTIPGSGGGITDAVLVFEAPARRIKPRPYHRTA